MITALRRLLSFSLALGIALLTLGRIRVNWTGGPTAQDCEDGRVAITRTLERTSARR